MTPMSWNSLKFTLLSLTLTKWHKYLMCIGETLLPEKRISVRSLLVLWFLLQMLFPLVTFGTLWNWVKQKGNFVASLNQKFKVLDFKDHSKLNTDIMLTFPTGKCRLILYYPGRTFHFPRATGKRNSRPLIDQKQLPCDII